MSDETKPTESQTDEADEADAQDVEPATDVDHEPEGAPPGDGDDEAGTDDPAPIE